MSLMDRLKDYFTNKVTLQKLLKVIAVLLIVFLLSKTWPVWNKIFKILITILKPFLIGFTIAYVLEPLVKSLQKRGLNKGLAIFLILVVAIFLFGLLMFKLFPLLYNESANFINTLNQTFKDLFNLYKESANSQSEIVEGVFIQISKSLANLQSATLDYFGLMITDFISGSIKAITTLLFSLIVAIYTLLDFESIKKAVKVNSALLFTDLPIYLAAVDKILSNFVKSKLVIMLIYFSEYTLVFYLLGHKAYLMIGILYVFATLVPYLGGMVVTAIGILTGLTMPRTNLFILIVLIGIMSQIDGYFISPYFFKKGLKVHPLGSILMVFVGATMFGPLGIMIALPIYISLREISSVYKEIHGIKDEELAYEKNI